jgi:tetratricopeptide (TPR) repeat protein
MAYPGNPELSPQAQDRVMTAFKQVMGKLQEGNREEALIGLEFVLRLDPRYAPAQNLHQQLSTGDGAIDLNDVMSHLQAPTTDSINSLLIEAMEDFNNGDLDEAKRKVDEILIDLPGHEEARNLKRQIDGAGTGESEVGKFLAQAREALAKGDSQEAANFVMMAQALDPHDKGIAEAITEIQRRGGVSLSQAGFTPGSEDEAAELFPPEETAAPDFAAATAAADLFSEVAEPPELQPSEVAPPQAPPPDTAETAFSFPEDPGPEPEPEAAAPAGDVSDLFEVGPATFDDPAASEGVDPDDPAEVIRDLLHKGGAAAAEDDFAAAIDWWSRVLLIDHAHEEALERIAHIRHAKEELDQHTAPMLADARDAFADGNFQAAQESIDRILSLNAKHVDANRLADEISGAAAPGHAPESVADDPSAETTMPELEDDLFSEDFGAVPDFGSEVPKQMERLEGEWRTPEKPKRRLPWQWWAVIGAVCLAIVAFTLWLGGAFVPKGEPEPRIAVVNRVLDQATDLFNQNRVEEAIVLLEQNSADDVFQVRIDKRLGEYRARVATPVPTPVPAGLAACREHLAEGRWMAAYERVMAELVLHPQDPGLEQVRLEILETEPVAEGLFRAIQSGDHRAAISIAKDLLDARPEDAEAAAIRDRSLFNAGMAELRAFNLQAAESFLEELSAIHPDDEEVQRILEFINTYKSRPVDMQLEIFIGSIAER